MKRRVLSVLLATVVLGSAVLSAGCSGKQDAKETLTVFNYGEYMDPAVLDLFYEETGIEVKYEEALTPEEMYTKYKAGAIDGLYDRKTDQRGGTAGNRYRCNGECGKYRG